MFDSATPWTAACQIPLCMGILQVRILEWVAIPSPEDLPEPGIKPMSLMSPALADGFFTTSATKVLHAGVIAVNKTK